MKFQLHIALAGEALRYQNELLDSMESEFQETRVRDHKVKPHLTIKYGFESSEEQIEQLSNHLKNLLRKFKGTTYTAGGFGEFNDDGKLVIYTKVQPSIELVDAYSHFYNNLKSFEWITFREYENPNNFIFHTTIASHINQQKLSEIQKFLVNKVRFFTEEVDEINLYVLDQIVDGVKTYKIYESYEL